MIDHTGIRVANLAVSKAFYQRALACLGYTISKEIPGAAGFIAKRNPDDDPGGDFWLTAGEPHAPRTHIAFRASSRERVDTFYREALAAGAKDNGPPGLRPVYHANYYAAFVLDPDGYNIEAVYHLASR